MEIDCDHLWQIVVKASKQEKSPQIGKNRKVNSNTKIENTSVDFSTSNYPEESINTYDTGGESE